MTFSDFEKCFSTKNFVKDLTTDHEIELVSLIAPVAGNTPLIVISIVITAQAVRLVGV